MSAGGLSCAPGQRDVESTARPANKDGPLKRPVSWLDALFSCSKNSKAAWREGSPRRFACFVQILLVAVDGIATEELRRLAKLFFDAQQLVVLCNAIRA